MNPLLRVWIKLEVYEYLQPLWGRLAWTVNLSSAEGFFQGHQVERERERERGRDGAMERGKEKERERGRHSQMLSAWSNRCSLLEPSEHIKSFSLGSLWINQSIFSPTYVFSAVAQWGRTINSLYNASWGRPWGRQHQRMPEQSIGFVQNEECRSQSEQFKN